MSNTNRCNVCGLDTPSHVHADIADCMWALMAYIRPEIREAEKFKEVVTAGYHAMKAELAKP